MAGGMYGDPLLNSGGLLNMGFGGPVSPASSIGETMSASASGQAMAAAFERHRLSSADRYFNNSSDQLDDGLNREYNDEFSPEHDSDVKLEEHDYLTLHGLLPQPIEEPQQPLYDGPDNICVARLQQR